MYQVALVMFVCIIQSICMYILQYVCVYTIQYSVHFLVLSSVNSAQFWAAQHFYDWSKIAAMECVLTMEAYSALFLE